MSIASRFRRERKRLRLSQRVVGALCGVSRRAVVAWEKDSKIPAEALAALIPRGLDAWYVLGGREDGTPQPVMLRPDEIELINLYRDLSLDWQVNLRITALAWLGRWNLDAFIRRERILMGSADHV